MTKGRRLRRPDVRPETVALARRRAAAGGALATGTDLSPEMQVLLLKRVARFLWGVIEQREGTGELPSTDSLWHDLSLEARAAVDRTFEATLVLWSRDSIHVEPCRRILDDQRARDFRYLLVLGDGRRQVVDEETLLMMAGIEP